MEKKEIKTMNGTEERKKPSLLACILILLFFAGCFIFEVVAWGTPDVHMTLIFVMVFAVVVLAIQGIPLIVVEEGVIHGCKIATIGMMILMIIGVMIPAWTGSGTIPVLIYYGLKIISPKVFLGTAVLVCAIACLVTGTSWGTIATFGVALMGIGHGLGIPDAWIVGAVVSGALFGDTLTPVSDFANVASGTCELDLFKHIKGMLAVTVPSLAVVLIVFTVMGFRFSTDSYDVSEVEAIGEGIRTVFQVTPLHALISLIPMVIILGMSIKKVNSLITITCAAIVAMLIAILFQGFSFQEMANFMNNGFAIESDNAALERLFNRGGLQSMMYTVSIGYLGLSLGGILEKAGVMEVLLNAMSKFTNSARSLVLTHTITGCLVAMISATDYVGILIPGRMYAKAYDKLGISRTVLSRTTISAGAVFGWLFPWTIGGTYVAGVLGVPTLEYSKYCIYIILILCFNLLWAMTRLFVPKVTQEEIDYREAREKM